MTVMRQIRIALKSNVHIEKVMTIFVSCHEVSIECLLLDLQDNTAMFSLQKGCKLYTSEGLVQSSGVGSVGGISL